MRVRGLGGELESLLPNPELALGFRVEARKLEHGFRRIGARIPYTLP